MLIGSIEALPPSPAPAREGVAFSGRGLDPAPSIVAARGLSAPPPAVGVLRQAVASANDALQAMSRAVEFEYDPETQQTVVRLVDTSDRRVLRQVPGPEMIDIARALTRMQSMLIHAKA